MRHRQLIRLKDHHRLLLIVVLETLNTKKNLSHNLIIFNYALIPVYNYTIML